MQSIAEAHVVIERDVADVFAYATDMERFGDWFPGVLEIVASDTLPPGTVGKRYLETVSVPLRGRTRIELTVRESVPNERFATEGALAPLLPRMEVRLRALEPGRSALEWAMFSRTRNAWVRALVLPFVRRMMQRRAERGLAALKDRLEATA